MEAAFDFVFSPATRPMASANATTSSASVTATAGKTGEHPCEQVERERDQVEDGS
jgi:hypothetical protein